MSLRSRIINALRPARITRDLDEELRAHLADAADHGRNPAEARRAFGSPLHHRESSRDLRLLPWLDSLRADAAFGWRQLMKRKVTSAAAVLSLALGIGSCTAAFRIIDALLFRPLPVAHAGALYSVVFQGYGVDGKLSTYDSCSYPEFLRFRQAAHSQAELIAVSYAGITELTYGADADLERAYGQYVSGWMFPAFGLRPAAGRLFTADDDAEPGAHPYAVLSYDYWTRRFDRNPSVIGRALRIGDTAFTIIGIGPAEFTGTETGILTDVFFPMAMKDPRTLASPNNYWLRTLVQLRPGVAPERVFEILRATHHQIQDETFRTLSAADRRRAAAVKESLLLEPATAGRSNLQRDYGRALTALAILVALSLLIACANVANLMMAQSTARAREMALRISIGAGRARLVQLLLIESAWIAFLAAALGGLFAWWSAPMILHMIDTPENPTRLVMFADWRAPAFSFLLALLVTGLFGFAPAIRASAIKPVAALRGSGAPSRHRVMLALAALQIAFCFIVHFVAGLFVNSFARLTAAPNGFSAERVLNLETAARSPQPPIAWQQALDRVRSAPGVDQAALTVWPMMSGQSDNSHIIANGVTSDNNADVLRVSPGFFDVLHIPILTGADFRASGSSADSAIVNQAFVKRYFNGQPPLGKSFLKAGVGGNTRFEIVGVVADARSRSDVRAPVRPTVYLQFYVNDAAVFRPSTRGTFVVRASSANPLALASALRREIPLTRPELRVGNIRTQTQIIDSHLVRERLLATLALFFAAVAILLAGIGLYGVLDYSVLQRRREIGIRIAIGARASQIARSITSGVLLTIFAGAVIGIALGSAAAAYIQSLLFDVRASSFNSIALPIITIAAGAFAASLPAVLRAIRTDPAQTLRSE